MEIHLRSGQSFQVDVEDITTRSHGVRELAWTTPDDWARRLHHVDMDQVAAIIAVRDGEPVP